MGCKRKGRISDRLLGVKVKSVDNNAKRLVTEEIRVSGNRMKHIKAIFTVDTQTLFIGNGKKTPAFAI